MNFPTDKTFVNKLSRDEKLFYLKGLTQISPEKISEELLKLITDEDPVVRGKAVLIAQDGPAQIIRQGARSLLDQSTAETTVLGLELLGALDNKDFSECLFPLLDHGDTRVRTTLIDTIPSLPPDRALSLLSELIDTYYSPELDGALEGCFREINATDSVPLLKDWFAVAPEETSPAILRLAAGLPGENHSRWIKKQLREIPVTDTTDRIIRRLLHASQSSGS